MKYLLVLAVVVTFGFGSCQVDNTVVGGGSTINNVTFTVDTLYLQSSGSGQLVAAGIAKNSAKTTITAPWYIEAQFYTDSTLVTKLGGSNTQIGVPLSSGQQTYWKIYFSTSAIDVHQFPDFRVGDLRAYYSN